MRAKTGTIGIMLLVLALTWACGGSAKLRQVRRQEMQASLGLSRGELEEERRIVRMGTRDTITYRDPEGREVILMKAVLDEDTGEMVAHEVIDAAVITARFRNIAERLGTVDIRFDIHVPAAMQDSRWQLRLSPRLYVQADTLTLPEVIVTGADYRKEQLRGYRMYERYLRSIITDSTRFVDWRNLRIWIERNLTDKESFGPDEQAALLHYTRKMLKRYHRRKWEERDKVFSQYVHSPIITEGVRLDTVLESTDEDLQYEYVQTLRTRPRLKKVEVVLSGAIYEDDVKLYTMPDTPPLAFYISSLSDLASPIERYVKKVVERRVTGHTSCELAFRSGRWELDEDLSGNRSEMARIRKQILELEGSETFLTDSIVIEAFASPEGSLQANALLTKRRAASVAGHFREVVSHYRDSAARSAGFRVSVREDGSEAIGPAPAAAPALRFLSRSRGENWTLLERLVEADTCLTPAQKTAFQAVMALPAGKREKALKEQPYYPHLRQNLYPRLRRVTFDFYLSRRGMVKDTVHTTEPDTVYRRGLELLRERDYTAALEILRPYRDLNTALACLALELNASALNILREQPRTPQVNYLMALLHARRQEDALAVQCFMDACREERSLFFRGNLDPEIHVLVERYGLDRDNENEPY